MLSPSQPRTQAQQAATYSKGEGGFYLAPRNPENALAFPPSRDKTTLPIPANRPNIDQNSHLGRAQLHREGQNVTKKGADSKRCGSNARNYEAKFRPTGCGGHKNSENAATFSEFLGQEDKLSPAPTAFRHISRQPRPLLQHFHPPDFRQLCHFHPPKTKSPSQYRKTTPISTAIPDSGGRNRTGRAKMSRDLGGADF